MIDLARECAEKICAEFNDRGRSFDNQPSVEELTASIRAYGEAVAARNAMLNRNTLAKAIWDSEIAEENFRGNKKDWAQWPDDFEKQPYCRSTLRQADFILERLRSEAGAVAVMTVEYGHETNHACEHAKKEFEHWCRETMLCDPENLERMTGGRGPYRLHNVQCWWIGWQASLAALRESDS